MGPIVKFRVPKKHKGKCYYVDPQDYSDFNLTEYIISVFDITRIEKHFGKSSLLIIIHMINTDPIHINLEKKYFIDTKNYKLVKRYMEKVYREISTYLAYEERRYKRSNSSVMKEMAFDEMLEKLGLYLESK